MAVLAALLAGVPVALVLHEGAHALSAWLLGGRQICLRRHGPRLEVEATLEGNGRVILFTMAGWIANVAAGLALALPAWGDAPRAVGIVNLLLALTSIVPVGTSDGARALALWRRGG